MRREGEKEGQREGEEEGGKVGKCAKGIVFTSTQESSLVPVYKRTQTHIPVRSDTHTSAY